MSSTSQVVLLMYSKQRLRNRKYLVWHAYRLCWRLWICDWFILSMRMQVILDSSFRLPGFSGKERKEERKGKEGEFRNWTYYTMAFADSNTVVSMQWFQCSVRSWIIGIYQYSFTNNELEISLVVVVVTLFHEGSTWQYEQPITQWPSKHSKYLH